MDINEVFHAYSRFGFGTNFKSASTISSRKELITELFRHDPQDLIIEDLPSLDQINSWRKKPDFKKKLRKLLREKDIVINGTWIEQLALSKAALHEKMTLFWHGHFACENRNPYYELQLNNILRKNAVGNFKTLLLEVSKSAAMIDYLHLKQNKKDNPNEDFARELCELFTLGRDIIYTEKDVKEIARAFTGWTHRLDGSYFFNGKNHDNGNKIIFGVEKDFTGEEVIDLILSQKACATFICTKFYRYFINPKINQDHIEEMSTVLYKADYNLTTLVKHVLMSDWFYEKKHMGKKIKSPVELLIGMMKQFDLKASDYQTYVVYQRVLEQVLFHPPNVAGWPGDQNWIDSARLSIRLRFPSLALNSGKFEFDPKPDNDSKPMENTVGLGKKATISCNWNTYFKNNPMDCDQKEVLLRAPLIPSSQKKLNDTVFETTKEQVLFLMSLPEFQMC